MTSHDAEERIFHLQRNLSDVMAENDELRAELTRLRSAPAQGGRDGGQSVEQILAEMVPVDSELRYHLRPFAERIALAEATPTPRDPGDVLRGLIHSESDVLPAWEREENRIWNLAIKAATKALAEEK